MPIYRGTDGWHTRGIGALAADVKWPFVGPAFGGIAAPRPAGPAGAHAADPQPRHPQRGRARRSTSRTATCSPSTASPATTAGKTASRITYGVDWSLDRPNLSITTHYRAELSDLQPPSDFPDGTGLTDRFSDIVGRTRIRYGRLIDLTHRYRHRQGQPRGPPQRDRPDRRHRPDLCPDRLSAAQPRHRSDDRGFARQGRAAARRAGASSAAIGRSSERPSSTSPTRAKTRCRWPTASSRSATGSASLMKMNAWSLASSWRRDYEHIGTFRKGSTFALHLALKGLGR